MAQTQRSCAICGTPNPYSATSCFNCNTSFKTTAALPVDAPAVLKIARLSPGQLLENRYRILAQVGTGGFGAVYKAEDTQDHGRSVAIKEIGLAGLTSQQVIEATDGFNREVTMLTDLNHPGIPHIYAHFTDPRHWYLVMDFIEGETLETYLSKLHDGCLPLVKTLQIAVQLCDILSYLHHRQPPIIYRDVKPSNVMLTPAGQLYLIDFGVARYFRPGKARDTIAFGSPGYAAPEQYGKAQTTPQSDIYSLGVTLYQLLTGVDPSLSPFRFPTLRVLNAALPIELETLVMSMLELEASKRPASAELVGRELQCLLDLQLASAAPSLATPSEQVERPTSFSTQGVTRYIHRAHRGEVLALCWSPSGDHIASGGEDRTVQVWQAFNGNDLFSYHNHAGAIKGVAWSPDGTRIASASVDHTVQVWDVTKRPRWLRSLAFLAGHYLMYDEHTGGVNAVAWSPDGSKLASVDTHYTVCIWRATVDPDRTVAAFHAHSNEVLVLAWSPDGTRIASASLDHTVRIWNARTKATSLLIREPEHVMHALAWSPNGAYLALGSSDHTVQIWNVANRQVTSIYYGHNGVIHSVAWSPDGRHIASGSGDSSVHIWEVRFHKNQPKPQIHASSFIYRQHEGSVLSVAWSPNGKYIASASADHTVHVWPAI